MNPEALEKKARVAIALQQARFAAAREGRLEQDREVRRLMKQGYSETIALCLYAEQREAKK